MNLTKKEAIELSIELWTWIAETGKEKEDWPGWEESGGQHAECHQDCFLCEYTITKMGGCYSCPYYTMYGLCHEIDTPYYNWTDADTKEDLKRYAQEFLEQLKALKGGNMNDQPIKVTETQLNKVQTHYIRTKKPIPVTLETYDDEEIVASFKIVEAWGEGYSDEEAIENLREDILRLFIDLKDESKDRLVNPHKQWKLILEDYLEEVEVP